MARTRRVTLPLPREPATTQVHTWQVSKRQVPTSDPLSGPLPLPIGAMRRELDGTDARRSRDVAGVEFTA